MSSQPEELSRAISQSPLLDFFPAFSSQSQLCSDGPREGAALSVSSSLTGLLFEILDCGCLRTSVEMYLASLTLGRLTHKLLACITGSGEALGVFSHLKPHVKFTRILLIIFDTRVNKNQGSLLIPHGCVSDQNPQLARAVSMPLELGKKVGQAAPAAWGQRSRSALFPCPCRPRAGLVMPCCWWWRRRLRREGLHELCSVTWSRAGFLFQFEKMTAFTLLSSFTLRWKMKILFFKLSTGILQSF